MLIKIDFNSDEAIYLQLRNQIILAIATSQFREGDSLPSVRQLADTVGINMHTVNKAYTVLRQEGFVKVDRRKGAVVAIDVNKMKVMSELKKDLQVMIAKGSCKNITREEFHRLIDEIYEEYGGLE
ncbi:MAG: GntR family transcriptional regulator [Lachnospiraceae bacterium]|nr:GntR family transcriptional regulator [Lachnospiraceae bacterium]